MKRLTAILSALLFCLSMLAQNEFTTTATDKTEVAVQYLSLDECKRLAIENNAKIKNAELDIEAAKLTKKGAFTKYFPQVSIKGGAFKATDPLLDMEIGKGSANVDFGNLAMNNVFTTLYNVYGPYIDASANVKGLDDGIVGGVMAVQPVFVGGRIVNGNKLAGLGVEAAKLQTEIARDETDLKTVELYWTIISLQEKKKIIASANQLLDTLYRDASGAVEAGIIHRNDMLKVTLKQSEMKSNEMKLNNGIRLAKSALCQHIGIPYDENMVLSDSIGEIPNPSIYHVDHAEAVKGRIEYQLLDLSTDAERLKKKMLVGEVLPQIAVGAGYTCNTLMDKFKTNGLVFATLSIPISDWWEKSYDLKKQELNCTKAENQRRDLDEQMLLQMQLAWNDLSEAYSQVMLSQQTAETATENLNLSTDNYNAGMISMSELLEAQTLLQQAHSQLADDKVDYMKKLTKYKQLTRQ
ncbi:MAG: TolC family protein [Bacteroidales bacterium]|nr:TolC family protein [Bacteroidales bacterium]